MEIPSPRASSLTSSHTQTLAEAESQRKCRALNTALAAGGNETRTPVAVAEDHILSFNPPLNESTRHNSTARDLTLMSRRVLILPSQSIFGECVPRVTGQTNKNFQGTCTPTEDPADKYPPLYTTVVPGLLAPDPSSSKSAAFSAYHPTLSTLLDPSVRQEAVKVADGGTDLEGALLQRNMNSYGPLPPSMGLRLRSDGIRENIQLTPSCYPVLASAYSSLLPERHCPPYAEISSTPEISSSSPQSSIVIPQDPGEFRVDASTPPEEEHCDCDTCITQESETQEIETQEIETQEIETQENEVPTSSHFSVSLVCQPSEPHTASTQKSSASQGTSWQAMNDSPNGSPISSPVSETHSPGHFDPLYNGISLDIRRKRNTVPGPPRKRPKRHVVDRPPGLPLGPWTPSDPIPLPTTMHSRKKRKVKRAPSQEPSLREQRSSLGKVACPECNALLLRKSMNRHLERHSNWTAGKYNAHLFCRYCFSAYSRRDSLIRHQKTDTHCVQLQYVVYSQERDRTPIEDSTQVSSPM